MSLLSYIIAYILHKSIDIYEILAFYVLFSLGFCEHLTETEGPPNMNAKDFY